MSQSTKADSQESPDDVAVSRFEQRPVLTMTLIIVVMLLIVEAFSYVVVRLPGFYKEFNRTVSGYYIFKNNPRNENRTQKTNPDDPDAQFDENGFIARIPVTLDKPEGTVRVFFMGGSAALGANQISEYRGLFAYPRGLYTWADSIAGQLEAYLEAKRPGTDFEVITAAAVTRAYHQSILYYLETVSRFSPDWVIGMDGFNDIRHLSSGTPYSDREEELQFYIDLQSAADCTRRATLSTYCLLEGLYSRLVMKLTRGRVRDVPAFARDFQTDDYSREQYLERKSALVAKSSRFVQSLNHEMGLMRADGIEFMFVLQPMLHRAELNKPLTPTEVLFATSLAPPIYAPMPSSTETSPPEFIDSMLVLKYFLDDYLTNTLQGEIAKAGYQYLDGNRMLTTVPATVEFFTDYCHTTKEGNRLIAAAIGDAMLAAR